MDKQTKSRIYLTALFAVFFGPLFFAMWLFYGPHSWLNSAMQNHGTLIQPARPLDGFNLIAIDNESWDKETFEGKWTLLYIGDEECDLYCEASLFKMRQVRLTLGRDSQRVARKYLGIDKLKNKQVINTILERYPHMQVSWFAQDSVNKSLENFMLQQNFIYLIDPLGNLMMQYSKDATAKGMKNDLKRLLKVSKIG